jgi:hypothetical protein
LTEEAVTPVWSEKALCGIDEEPPDVVDEPEAAVVVVVEDELVELQAAATSPVASTSPSATDRRFRDAEGKAPP